MLEDALKNLEEIKAQAATLSEEDRERILAPLGDHPNHVFDLVKQGRALELYVTLLERPELQTRQDEYGMTPLHHASIDPTGTLAAVMIEHPSEAMWMRDRFGRIPLDVAEEMGEQTVSNVIAPMTYPRLFNGGEFEIDPFGVEHSERFKETLKGYEAIWKTENNIKLSSSAYLYNFSRTANQKQSPSGKHQGRD